MVEVKGPLCVVCKKNRVPKHELPVRPYPPVCDECQRTGMSAPGNEAA